MGEETKQEQPKAEENEPVQQERKEEKPAEDQKEELKTPSPFVLFVDLHCVGCAKKIEKSIMRMRGVEGVTIDTVKNQVTIKGIVEHQAICAKIMKKTKRRAEVLSPVPAAEGELIPEVVTSQVSGSTTVELNVNMHCEACAEQLKKKILKMRGVQTAATEFSTGKVTVTGTMDANKLAEYVYRSTKKQAKIVPRSEPEPVQAPAPANEPEKAVEEKKEADVAEKPAEETKPEEKNEGEMPPAAAAKNEVKKEEAEAINSINNVEEETMQRMMYYYQPLYVIERIPPPQLFSDENPNACCIS